MENTQAYDPDDVIKKLSALAGVDVTKDEFPYNPELEEAFKLVDTNLPTLSEASTKISVSEESKQKPLKTKSAAPKHPNTRVTQRSSMINRDLFHLEEKKAPKGRSLSKGKPTQQIQQQNSNLGAKPGTFMARHQKFLDEMAANRHEDNMLKDLETKRFALARKRLKDFVAFSDMSDFAERKRLLAYFSHRYYSMIMILKDAIRTRKLIKQGTYKGPYGAQGPAGDQNKNFILTNKAYEAGDFDEAEAARETKKQLSAYKKSHNLPKESKIFKVIGAYHAVKDDLIERGWIENDWEPRGEKDKFKSQAWDFFYPIKARDAFRIPVGPDQYVNHIQGLKALTTKVGLTHNMKNLVWQHSIDIGEIFPQSYDLSDLGSEEVKDFKEEVRFNQVVSFLKVALLYKDSQIKKQWDKISAAIAFVERRVYMLSGEFFELMLKNPEFTVSPFDQVTEDQYEAYLKETSALDFSKAGWYRPLQRRFKDFSCAQMLTKVKEVLQQLCELIGEKQFGLTGSQNAWILKPGGKSRGRGIEVHADMNDLLKSIMISRDSIWVVQKYIERPLIILQKKFDIRQWVLVSSVEPLRVWIWQKPYLRFSSADYDPNNLRSKFAHLTNASISETNPNACKLKVKGQYAIKENMWHSSDFQQFLNNEFAKGSEDLWTTKIYPQLKKGVYYSLLSVVEQLQHRDRSHTILGYDFMVDQDLNVWLIEVNSSPCMEYSTHVTTRLCPMVLKDTLRSILDGDNGNQALDGMSKTGNWELIQI